MSTPRAWHASSFDREDREQERDEYKISERRAKGTLGGGITIIIVGALFCFVFFVSGGYLFYYGLVVIALGVVVLTGGGVWLCFIKKKTPTTSQVVPVSGLFNTPALPKEPPPPYSPPIGPIYGCPYDHYGNNANPFSLNQPGQQPDVVIDESGAMMLPGSYSAPVEVSTQTGPSRTGLRSDDPMTVTRITSEVPRHPSSPPPPYLEINETAR